tara:strand:- start:177 stop:365 length:189 start_codon:yes stop_codon:yes gene_type:complete
MFRKMTITNAKYLKDPHTDEVHAVYAIINGQHYSVPMVLENTMYAEIKRQVDAGELTIEEAD